MKKLKYIIKYKKNKGFAMVEALVAITILVTSIIAPLTLAMQSSKYSRIALQRVQASYLADEGIELLVNYRKSLTQFCSHNPDDSHCNLDVNNTADSASFNSFVSEMTNQITQGCHLTISEDQAVVGRYCALDKSSFSYTSDTTAFPTFTKYLPTLEVDKLYQVPNSIMTYNRNLTGATQTIYSRVFYVQDVDTPIDANSGIGSPLSAKVVSIACFAETTCTLASKNKVVVEQYITR
jgi:type II secretory pathway pseudopilin PulG